jgi:Zn-dependent protease
MKCEYCGRDEALPFVCNYCGGAFCADHRLPEAHQCKGDLTQRRMIIPPPQTTVSWSDSGFAPPVATRAKGASVFSEIEIRDIVIAWFALGVAFFIAETGAVFNIAAVAKNESFLYPIFGKNYYPTASQVFLISLFSVGPGFVLHELSHKFVAERHGLWAEFRMWPVGLLIALATSIIGFIFAAPGATYISGNNISKSDNGLISIAGPLTNVGVAMVFLPILLFGTGVWEVLGFVGLYINLFLAAFNMLPIMPLDGAKVFQWSKARWAILFVPLVIVVLVLISL